MRKIVKNIFIGLFFAALLTSCTDFLNIRPKGQKIPVTLADFETILRNESATHTGGINEASYLMNDLYLTYSNRSYSPMYNAEYMWDESVNRTEIDDPNEDTFFSHYRTISNCNIILENYQEATEASETEKKEVAAYATVLRSMAYFVLANYYATGYNSATAASEQGIPLIESAGVNAPHKQVSIKEIYDFMINTVEAVVNDLPAKGMTILHPSKGAGYAFLARVYLHTSQFDKALEYANKALSENDRLYDWVSYYQANKAAIEDPSSYSSLSSPTGFDYVENYNYKHGSSSWIGNESNIPIHRAEQFEAGDARAAARWKFYDTGYDKYMMGMTSGYFNYGGMTTVEVYLIKAECLARAGQTAQAMDVLNKVRKTRILPEFYSPLSASSLNEAMASIMRTKRNEMILTIVPFADAKRLNAEGKYLVELSKDEDGKHFTLSPSSHLWTMPFPMSAMQRPGNGTIKHNVSM